MFTQMVNYFYPDLKKEEIKKFGILALAFFFTIGAYWALRLAKDVIFFKLAFPVDLGWSAKQGADFQPLAKTFSVVVVFLLVILYSKLVDWFEKHKLFYIIGSFYALLFAGVATALWVQSWPQGNFILGRTVLATVGWVSYFAIESFGSILVALFWSFTASVTASDAAKRGYPLIIAAAQIGAIGGSALNFFTATFGPAQILALSCVSVIAVMFSIRMFMRVIPAQDRMGNREAHATEKKKEGFFEGFIAGLRLLVTRKYLFGILIVSTFYEVINTIVDYQMKAQASLHAHWGLKHNFQEFLSMYGLATNSLAFVMALLGTSYIIKRWGLTISLLFFPTCLGVALVVLYGYFLTNPGAGYMLWATFAVMMLAKGLSYAVSNPTKEMMYIPTSKDAKFKSKGWIDMFGGRLSKAGGARISDLFKNNLNDLMIYGTFMSLGLVGLWFVAALYVGRKNAKLTKEGHIVE